jgi:hypothetical protein
VIHVFKTTFDRLDPEFWIVAAYGEEPDASGMVGESVTLVILTGFSVNMMSTRLRSSVPVRPRMSKNTTAGPAVSAPPFMSSDARRFDCIVHTPVPVVGSSAGPLPQLTTMLPASLFMKFSPPVNWMI